MTTLTGAKPHPIFLAGRWVDSPDPLVIHNPAHPDEPAGMLSVHDIKDAIKEAPARRWHEAGGIRQLCSGPARERP